MYNSQYEQAAKRFEAALLQQPTNKGYLKSHAEFQMLSGQHQQAIDGYLKLYPGKNGKLYDIRLNENFDSTINMIWMWQQTNETAKADQLISELKQLLAEFPDQNESYRQAMIAAVEGDSNLSAQLFFEQYKDGKSRAFWRGNHLPMLAEVMKSPISQDFGKLYEYEINQQRNRVLAFEGI